MTVTEAVEEQSRRRRLQESRWLSELDVRFAGLYFDALVGELSSGSCPESWKAILSVRNQVKGARIQFALAGMNAHINHDLPMAIVSTCQSTNTVPQHGTPQYNDYTSVNPTLDSLIDEAKQKLNVRLPGDPLPAVSHLEDIIATWDLSTFREMAWDTAQSL